MAFALNRRTILTAAAGAALLGPLASRAAKRRKEHIEYFEVTRSEVFVPGLDPAHDGLVIAQLSDIHIGRHTPDGRVIAAVRELNDARPDLVALTGDYVTTRRDPFERVPLLLKNIRAPAVAVLGNHDHWSDPTRIRKDLEALGFAVLLNRNTSLDLRGVPFPVVGVDDGHTNHDDVHQAFAGVKKRGFRLVLTHSPPTANQLPEDEGLLCLSGHTHGGHFVVPGVTEGLFRTAGQPYVRGLYDVRGNQLYVNRGLGFGRGGPVVRVNSEPELALLTLRPA